MTMFAAVIAVAASLTAGDHRPGLVLRGGDPGRGLLVNVTAGARPFDPPDPGRPTVVFIHGFNPAHRIVHFGMAEQLAASIARRGGPPSNVLGWDWNAATFDSLRPGVNSENAVRQGHALAASLLASGLDPARTHLIGQSAGGMVATSAAWVFAARQGRPVAQLTLLDPATFYHEVIFERLNAGALAPLVENYWSPGPSAFGREVRLPGVRDVRIDGRAPISGVLCPLRSDHLSLVTWYLGTAEDPTRPMGYNSSRLLSGSR